MGQKERKQDDCVLEHCDNSRKKEEERNQQQQQLVYSIHHLFVEQFEHHFIESSNLKFVSITFFSPQFSPLFLNKRILLCSV